MTQKLPGVVGRVAYGALFVVLVPVGLAAFARFAPFPIRLDAMPLAGWVVGCAGLAAMLWGMADIVRLGRGLPMNAFPPERLVRSGIYAVLPQPIYLGFTLVCLGASLALGSAAGALLATPLVALSTLALWLGHERPHLLATFGELPQPLLGYGRLVAPALRALRLDRAWGGVLRGTERLANSWQATRVGPVRIINHAVFAGLAGGLGAFLVVLAAGPGQTWAVWAMTITGVVGAAAIGQVLVGSSNRQSRPFGYFGGLAGIVVAGVAVAVFDRDVLLVLAAFTLAGPWVQAIGRLRCLVQGCCHGAPVQGDPGIRIENPHSRVVALAGLGGECIYPTQLYSIVGNLMLGVLLALLWWAHVSVTLVGGLYLALAGIIRFIEEGYRGEPLTPVFGGLHIYQWFAVAMLVAGFGVMLVPSQPAPPFSPLAVLPAAVTGIVFFLVCGLAMGVDFPDSQWRFSRLSG